MPLESYQRHLLFIQDDKGESAVNLDKREYTIGRDHECDIRLCSLFVSRHHATLVRVPVDEGIYAYRIVDGKPNGPRSANGLLINGTKLRSHDLQDDDEVVFGPQVRLTYRVLQREPDITEPFDGLDPITLINPGTADRDYDTGESSADALNFSWGKGSQVGHLSGPRRLLLNFQRVSNLRPKKSGAK